MTEKLIRTNQGALRTDEAEKEDYVTSLSWLALKRFAFFLKSQTKYPPGNWKSGMSIERYERGLLRHVQKYMANKYEGGSVEKGYDHAAAILFNIMGLLHEEEKAKLKT